MAHRQRDVIRYVRCHSRRSRIGISQCLMRSSEVVIHKVKCYRIFNGGIGSYRRLAIALGIDPATPIKPIFGEYEEREKHPIKPECN